MPILKFPFAPDGVVAQLVERLNGIQEVAGSIPVGSTILAKWVPTNAIKGSMTVRQL